MACCYRVYAVTSVSVSEYNNYFLQMFQKLILSNFMDKEKLNLIFYFL